MADVLVVTGYMSISRSISGKAYWLVGGEEKS